MDVNVNAHFNLKTLIKKHTCELCGIYYLPFHLPEFLKCSYVIFELQEESNYFWRTVQQYMHSVGLFSCLYWKLKCSVFNLKINKLSLTLYKICEYEIFMPLLMDPVYNLISYSCSVVWKSLSLFFYSGSCYVGWPFSWSNAWIKSENRATSRNVQPSSGTAIRTWTTYSIATKTKTSKLPHTVFCANYVSSMYSQKHVKEFNAIKLCRLCSFLVVFIITHCWMICVMMIMSK
jgi:hypothetical protein